MSLGRFSFWKKEPASFSLGGTGTIFSSVSDFSNVWIHFELFFFFFELCWFCTWLEFAHFFSMHIFIFSHVVPMQNDKTGACECILYFLWVLCVCSCRESSLQCWLAAFMAAYLSGLWAESDFGEPKNTHTSVGKVFLNFAVWFSFAVFSQYYVFPPQIIYGFR